MAFSDFDAGTRGQETPRTSADELDVPLEDPVQMEEVELLSSLMIQAGGGDEPLDDEEIDRALGIAGEDDTDRT